MIDETMPDPTGEVALQTSKDAPALTPACEIEPFCWSGDHQHQAFVLQFPFEYLPKDALHYLKLETRWSRVEPIEDDKWTLPMAIDVGLGKIDCPFCSGNMQVWRLFVGAKTGLRTKRPMPCDCLFHRLFFPRWYNAKYVSLDYQHLTMGNVEQFKANFSGFMKISNFPALMKLARNATRNCMLWVGPAGTGKSTLMAAMYHNALYDWAWRCFKNGMAPTPAVWKISAPALAKQHVAWAMKDEGRDPETGVPTMPPEVTPNKVLAAIRDGHVPYLFLDEFDKIKMGSEFQAKEFATLIDTIQSNGGVVIVAANCSEETLQSRLGDEIGPALVRRLIGPRMNPDKLDQPTSPDRCGILVDFEDGSINYGHKLVQVHLKRRGGHAHEDGKDKTDKTGKSRDLDVTDDEGVEEPTYLTVEDAVAGNKGTSKGAKVQVTPHK